MTSQEKQDFLVDNFEKLDEKRKDHIRELTRKLAEIHCENDFHGRFGGKKTDTRQKTANNPI